MSKPISIPGLTPLRGIAALLVIIFHFHTQLAPLLPGQWAASLEKGYLMVDLFFVLSGFVMYHVYGGLFKLTTRFRHILTFMGARLARIYPLHLVTLSIVIVIAIPVLRMPSADPFFKVVYDFSAIPSHFLLLQAMGTHHEATWNTPSWSISVEWWTYALFPFIVSFLAKTGRWSRWLMAAGILAGYLLIMFHFQPDFWAARWRQFHVPGNITYPVHIIDIITGPAILRCLCGFCWGMLLYEGYQKKIFNRWWNSDACVVSICLLLLAGWQLRIMPDPLAVFLFGLLISNLANNTERVQKIMRNKQLVYLGDISYSLYLVHMPLIFAYSGLRRVLVNPDPFRKFLGFSFPLPAAWAGLILLLVMAIGLAGLTYKYVEKPARIRLRKRLAFAEK